MERKNKNEWVSDEAKELGGEVIIEIEVGKVMNEIEEEVMNEMEGGR